jgi:hypothetical protein
VLAGGVLLAGLALFGMHRSHPRAYRLRLDTVSESVCYYGSAWNQGPIELPADGVVDANGQRTITLTNEYDYRDGCTWAVREVLRPISATEYSYQYSERPVSCHWCARPGRACPRSGVVTLEPIY